MATQHALMNLTMVLEPSHVCNTKKGLYVGKDHLEVDRMDFTSAWMTSPPDPLSAMEQSHSVQPYAERGKEIEAAIEFHDSSRRPGWSSGSFHNYSRIRILLENDKWNMH
jgi:hypothetical protein